MDALRLDDISKSFSGRKVLDGISLTVEKGEIFGLLGPSGAGKTTIIRILTGQLTADGGSSFIGGVESEKQTADEKKRYGIMMDDFGLYKRLSCTENLKVFARIYGLDNSAVDNALKQVGLYDHRKKAAGALSKGMHSRLRLARVFMIQPDILFLDEPTSGLDPSAADAIQKLIIAQRDSGRTVFLTTHNMAEASKLCGRVGLLCDGKLIECGAPDEICRRYDSKKTIRLRLYGGEERVLPHTASSAEAISELLAGGRVETIHSSEPDLETVFTELTGKELSA